MDFDFDHWYNNSVNGEVIYTFKGEISADLITSVLTAIEERLIEQNEAPKVIKKVYNVLVESLQNLYHHIDTPPSTPEQSFSKSFAAFILHKQKNLYTLTTGNFVRKDKIRLLSDRMDQINYLSSDELKAVYKIILNNSEFSEKGGGGLGMIDIVRKTGNKLDYKFEDYDPEFLFFILNIAIV
jgi:hypothetical protein